MLAASAPAPKPRLLPLLIVGEFVGTFIANFISLGVIQAAGKLVNDAQTTSLMGQLNPLVQVPPEIAKGIPGHPALAPQKLVGNVTGMLGGNVVQPASLVGYPQPGLLIAVGIALAYGIALQVTPHNQLNPTFTVAMALFGARKWMHVIPCALAQMVGGLCACFLMWTCSSPGVQCIPNAAGALVCAHLPKTVQTAGLWGVQFPPADPWTWRPGGDMIAGQMEFGIGSLLWSNIVFTALMVIVIIPMFAGNRKLPQAAKPPMIALVIIPFVIAQSPFGVQNNAALFISGLIFCSMAGFPSELWSYANYYWVVVAFSPFVGAAMGVGFLKVFGWLTSETGPLYEKVPHHDVEDARNPQQVLLPSGGISLEATEPRLR